MKKWFKTFINGIVNFIKIIIKKEKMAELENMKAQAYDLIKSTSDLEKQIEPLQALLVTYNEYSKNLMDLEASIEAAEAVVVATPVVPATGSVTASSVATV